MWSWLFGCGSALAIVLARPAEAEPLATTRAVAAIVDTAVVGPTDGPSAPARPRRPANALYLEGLGKAGLWGLGYDRLLLPYLAVGATASVMRHGDERLFVFAPYASIYPRPAPRHRWIIQAGATAVHLRRPSPVPEWPGSSATGVGAHLGTGYERRGRVLLRAVGLITMGRGGVAPWLGVSAGVTW